MKLGDLRNNVQGFTLVETIIVLAIFGLVIPSVFSIITAIVRQQADIYRLTEMKRQGDYALGYIKQTILNDAEHLYAYSSNPSPRYDEICAQDGASDEFFETTNDGRDFRMSTKDDPSTYMYFHIETDNTAGTSLLLHEDTTGDSHEITTTNVYIPYFHIECFQKNDFATPLVGVQFAVVYKNKSGQQVDLNPLVYQTKFKLRR
jgi:prepilin-type N-terminal cleavage/methylation domain-containing protein